MAQPRRYTYNSTSGKFVLGGQDVLNLDWNVTPFSASIVVDLVQGGSIIYAVEYTTDSLETGNPTTWRWLPTAGFPYNTTNTIPAGSPPSPQQWSLTFPVTAIRLNIQSLTGTVNFSVIQGHDI